MIIISWLKNFLKMRFKIPANTELEDKILPFLTIRQLIILVIWWVLCYVVFNIFFALWYIPAVWGTIDFIIWWFTVAAAFLKVNHLEFHRWFALLVSKLFVPQKRFFNNWLLWWQYFDVLNITTTWTDKKKKNIEKKEEEKNNLDEMKNEIFWKSEKKSFDNFDDDYEIDEFKKRFW